ncbi:ABC transporter permease [Chelatococcus sambhunathii]|uniref:ABC transporter permease n=1 Tax=Chelatococcus sambhunathii TaxID=363953 RepID=A0ABU1DKC1_9HYPH|nr:ABC transporter permease [Chelatococcus sambhunathii]MDR4308576.1 ABC transporter permease [Chelatococcus sambhunathii]
MTDAFAAPPAPEERQPIAVPTTPGGPPAPAPRGKLSPLNRRRFANFRANRRGWWSFWLFAAVFVVSLFAEFIANDKPFLVKYDGAFYFPAVRTYTETTFGGDFETEADYRDPYLQNLIKKSGGYMVWPPVRYSYDTINRNLPTPAPSAPTWMLTDEQCSKAAADRTPEGDAAAADVSAPRAKSCGDIEWNWLGTDDQGRDVLARLIYGFRISVVFGLVLTLLSSVIGVAAGAVQGYFGGWTDLLFQRFIEIWTSVPTLYLLIILSAVLAPSFWVLLGILLLFSWTALVGVVRAEFLRGRNFEYVRAARALGVSNGAIMFRHLLPNAMVATLTFMPFILSGSISTLTALDFLGFGLPPGSPSLGELLAQGKANLQAPWLGVSGFMVIAVTLSLLIFVGEAVRDAFDPRKTFR